MVLMLNMTQFISYSYAKKLDIEIVREIERDEDRQLKSVYVAKMTDKDHLTNKDIHIFLARVERPEDVKSYKSLDSLINSFSNLNLNIILKNW